jgi:tRNA (guanine-N7-)-methyltransferase
MARVLAPAGEFRFASDIAGYVNWTLLHARAHPCLEWTAAEADDWRKPWSFWPGTRYEAKAVREGRPPAYICFRRR